MRTTKGVVITLLLLCLRAMSQQDGQASPAAASETSQTGQPARQKRVADYTAHRAQPNSHAQGPTTMDQVVDRIIEREQQFAESAPRSHSGSRDLPAEYDTRSTAWPGPEKMTGIFWVEWILASRSIVKTT